MSPDLDVDLTLSIQEANNGSGPNSRQSFIGSETINSFLSEIINCYWLSNIGLKKKLYTSLPRIRRNFKNEKLLFQGLLV